MHSLYYLFVGYIAVFGAFIGSFVNVILLRFDDRKNPFWKGRSKCPKCHHVLGWLDLIPIVSYLSLGGKCRYCKTRFSSRYFWTEILFVLGFAILGWYFFVVQKEVSAFSWQGLLLLGLGMVYVSNLLAIFIYDTLYQLIPEIFVWINIVVGTLILLLIKQDFILIGYQFLGALILAFLIFAIFFLSKKMGMGLGDVELIFMLGILVDFRLIFIYFFLAFFVGSLYGIIFMFLNSKDAKTQVAFGPALVIAFGIINIFEINFMYWQNLYLW
jgi:prepilin signal peptidase PulO-like enzyme (type II secretory pathway)